MRRRDFIAQIAACAFAPTAARSQPAGKAVRKIAYLGGGPDNAGSRALVGCFRKQLQSLGWREGDNISTAARWVGGVQEKYEAGLAELMAGTPDVLVVTSTPAAILARRRVTDRPVVFMSVSDPVRSGIVANLARPGGNITGVSNFLPATTGKLLEILIAIAGRDNRPGVFYNPDNAGKLLEWQELQAAGRSQDVRVEAIELRASTDLARGLADFRERGCRALIVLHEGVTQAIQQEIVAFCATNNVPAIYQIREYVDAGGLISYGLNYCDHYSRAAVYVDKVLRGAQPADLPVEQPTKFELVINARVGKALNLTIPATLLATADEVIE